MRLGGSLALLALTPTLLIPLILILVASPCLAADPSPRRIGYTQLQTNLPGGRHANVRTMRSMTVLSDGSERRPIAAELVDEPDEWTQFVAWSPDGKTAVVGLGWQDPANAAWEEEHQTFRMTTGGWKLDSYLIDVATGKSTNVTGVDRVSDYNGGLFFWPNDPDHLGFTALINGNSHPFKMDRDGRNKIDLSSGADEFTYGFSSSPDGKRIAYHKGYVVHLANSDGSNLQRIETGHPFNFAPSWSPDGEWVLFVAGEHYNCHPHVVQADGTGLRKLADRGGYKGVTEFLDVPDFHGGSSDVPVFAADGESVFYNARVGEAIELHQVTLDGTVTQLTRSAPGTTHYHPSPSPDGEFLLYGSKRDGARQLFVRRLSDGSETQLTDNSVGEGSMWAYWGK